VSGWIGLGRRLEFKAGQPASGYNPQVAFTSSTQQEICDGGSGDGLDDDRV